MTDEPTEHLIDTGREGDLVEEAANLVGTERLWSGQLLYTGVEVGLFEVLDATPMSADDVADELDLHPDSCYRVLRTLDYFGVVEEDDDRRFSLTAVGELFRADHPRSVHRACSSFGAPNGSGRCSTSVTSCGRAVRPGSFASLIESSSTTLTGILLSGWPSTTT